MLLLLAFGNFRTTIKPLDECEKKEKKVTGYVTIPGSSTQKFASDRRHMRKPDGSWMKPPPPYDCISTQEAVHNLDEFISMDNQGQFWMANFRLEYDFQQQLAR